jgi:cell division septation protein DedD
MSTKNRKNNEGGFFEERAIAIFVICVVAALSFTLGYFVGKATHKPEIITTVVKVPIETIVTVPAEAPPEPIKEVPAPVEVNKESDIVTTPAKASAPKRPRPTKETKPGTAVQEQDERFSVQIGAYENLEDAQGISKKYTDKGYNAYVLRKIDNTGHIYFKVRIGNFSNRDNARRMQIKLKAIENQDTFIVEGQ